MSKPTSVYLKLARRIAADERDGVERRYEYGSELLKARAGRERLPKGFLADRIAEWMRAGLPVVSEVELQRYMKFAEVYPTKAHRRHAMTLMGSWFEIVKRGFPAVSVDEELTLFDDDLDDISAPDEWEQMQFDIPGLNTTISVRGRTVPLVKGDDGATVADVAAYLDMCKEKHDNYGKTIARIEQSLETMREGADGDEAANAVEAWEAATGERAS